MLNGLNLALKNALPKSYVYIFTDALVKDYELEETVFNLIQQKQVTVCGHFYDIILLIKTITINLRFRYSYCFVAGFIFINWPL